MHHPDALAPIIDFLRGIGIGVEIRTGAKGFLPGVDSQGGVLQVDPDTLAGSGDLLHEAGHIAILPRHFHPGLGSDLQAGTKEAAEREPDNPVLTRALHHGEFMAQAWSAAAALHLGLPLDCIFFPGSYKVDAYEGMHPMQRWLESGSHPGPNALAQAGMTGYSGLFAVASGNGLPPFPHMTRWVQD